MTGTDTKTLARRVLEEIFPANDLGALREAISDQFVNHEAPAGAGLVRCLSLPIEAQTPAEPGSLAGGPGSELG